MSDVIYWHDYISLVVNVHISGWSLFLERIAGW